MHAARAHQSDSNGATLRHTYALVMHDPTTCKFVLVLSEVGDLVVNGNDDAYIQHFRDGLVSSFASKNDDGTNEKSAPFSKSYLLGKISARLSVLQSRV